MSIRGLRKINAEHSSHVYTPNMIPVNTALSYYSGREKLTFKCRAFETKFSRKR